MIDYSKYDNVQTKEVLGYKGDYNSVYKALEDRETKVNKALKKIQSEGYDIIDIKQDVIYSNTNFYCASATIYYGKPKTNKK